MKWLVLEIRIWGVIWFGIRCPPDQFNISFKLKEILVKTKTGQKANIAVWTWNVGPDFSAIPRTQRQIEDDYFRQLQGAIGAAEGNDVSDVPPNPAGAVSAPSDDIEPLDDGQ